MVLADGGHRNGLALRIFSIDPVESKGLGHRIKFVQELITQAPNPQRAGTVFEEGSNVHPAQTVGAPGLVLEHFERVAIVAIDPILRTKPHEALIVLHNLDYPRRSEERR